MTEVEEKKKVEVKYTKEYLKELDKELKMASLVRDYVFKSIMMKNSEVFRRFLIQTLDIKLDSDEDDNMIFLDKELPKDIGKNLLITVEVNRSNFNAVKERNEIFLQKLNVMRLQMKDEYQALRSKYVYQLNLNADDDYVGVGENIVMSYDITSKQIYNDKVKNYIKHLEYYKDLYYTNCSEMREDEIFLASLMSENFTTLNDILSNILSVPELNRFMESVINMSRKWVPLHEWEKEAMDNLVKEAEREIIYKEAREEGIELGIE